MHRQLVVGVLLTVLSTLASAGEGTAAAGPRLELRDPLAAMPPLAPVLATAEGATDAGGSGHILSGAIYGGLVGAAIGAGVGLIEGGNYGRDVGIGAGVGILAGAALGAANVFGDHRPLPATDGLGSTDRDPVIKARTIGVVGRF
jgi:hypothetical protein